jgi:hypothetical protein
MRVVLLSALSLQPAAPSTGGAGSPTSYPLDAVDRTMPATGPVVCPTLPLVVYRGTKLLYRKPARVHPAFAERLRRFEDVVVEVAREQFGRAPLALTHAGTYSCRRIARYPTLLSEHGLGNGIDVVGFSFPRLPRGQRSDLPPELRRPFEVTLADWQRPARTPRARFLDALARRLVARHDIFNVMLGPAYPGHRGHFHFDVAPYRVVSIWTEDDDAVATR